MDGLLVYRQYLENIRLSLNNLKLPELKSKEFMGILKRVNQIEDLSYIDIILKNAGLSLSFISNRDFLNEKVVLKSKLDAYFNLEDDTSSVMQDALLEYLSDFILEEDEIINDIESLLGEDGVPEISLDYFPQSSEKYYSAEELIERNKSTLSALFGALDEMDMKLQKAEEVKNKKIEELGIVEEFFDEDTPDEELVLEDKGIGELISEEIDNHVKDSNLDDIKSDEVLENFNHVSFLEKNESADNNENFDEPSIADNENEGDSFEILGVDDDLELEDDAVPISFVEQPEISGERENDTSDILDTSFLLDDSEDLVNDNKNSLEDDNSEDNDIENDNEYGLEDDSEDEGIENNNEYDLEDDSEDDDFSNINLSVSSIKNKNFNDFFDETDIEDKTGFELEEDLIDEDDEMLRDTDPIEQNAFEDAANYFLTGKSQGYSDDSLRKLYKSKEKIVNAEGVNDTDDSIAKMILAVTDGLLNLPHLTGGIFRKAKKSGRKMRENMIVEDDDDE